MDHTGKCRIALALFALPFCLFAAQAAAQCTGSWAHDGPIETQYAAATTDTHRGRVVYVDGTDPVEHCVTWEWDGEVWTRVAMDGPTRRQRHAVAYDPIRRRTVLFGGQVPNSVNLGDTWEWDGATWTQIPTTNGPLPRRDTALVFDAVRGRTLLFGGQGTIVTNDTWEWDGATWTLLNPPTRPPGMWGHAMAFDPTVQQVILFGGGTPQTWSWNGATGTWTFRTSSGPFDSRYAGMSYDPTMQRVVLFGGGSSGSWPGRTFSWDSTTGVWTQHAPTQPNLEYPLLVPDPVTGSPLRIARLQLSRWVNSSWSDISVMMQRWGHAMVYDSTRDRMVVFGGYRGGATPYLGDTLEYDGRVWSVRSSASAPSARAWHTMAYDSIRGRVVLFGGRNGNLRHVDTWEWDGQQWELRATTGPPASAEHSMAFDASRGVMVLFGEWSGDQIWEWDGQSWQSNTPPEPRPLPHSYAQLIYRPERQRLIYFGGLRLGPPFESGDWIWEYDGHTGLWSRLVNDNFDQFGEGAATFDESRQTIVAHSGQAVRLALAATMEFQESGFAPVAYLGPGVLLTAAMAYDTLRERVVMTGGIPRRLQGVNAVSSVWFWTGPAEPIPAGISAGLPDETYFRGQTLVLPAQTQGTEPITYRWTFGSITLTDGVGPGGATVSGATTNTLTVGPLTDANAGTYLLTVTDQCPYVGYRETASMELTIGTCVGDLDSSGIVELQDLATLLAHFGQTGPQLDITFGDIDHDDDVDLQDMAYLLAVFGESCP